MIGNKTLGGGHHSRREFLSVSAASALGISCGNNANSVKEVSAGPRPNVVVFMADALRADHLSSYGYGRPTTPEIDRFSRESYVFEQCYSTATWTLPATTSLLTGTSAFVHRVVVNEFSKEGKKGQKHHVLSNNLRTTAECLAESGYNSGYFESNPNAAAYYGLSRGCQKYFFEINVSGAKQIDVVLDWLRTEAQEPFYAFVHLIDPHGPYKVDFELFETVHGKTLDDSIADIDGPERERVAAYHTLDWDEVYADEKVLWPRELRTFTPSGISHMVRLYDAEIRGIDRQFRRLVSGLESLGFMDRTAMVFTSDHGEAFGEEDRYLHASCIQDAQTHIPLIIHLPGQKTGARVPWTVEISDIHPTLLTLASMRVPAVCTGSTLFDGRGNLLVTEDRSAFTTLDRYSSAVIEWNYGLTKGPLRLRMQKGTMGFEVYSLSGALGSLVRVDENSESREPKIVNLIAEVREIRTRYRNLNLDLAIRPTWSSGLPGESTEEQLKALGYM